MMSNEQQQRENVSAAYAKAVTSPSTSMCCGPVQKGVVVKLAGYSKEELEALPPEAVVNSFGCGNPLAFSEVREGQVVLDLGSGAGIDILLAAKKVGPTGRAIGIDMTDEMIAKARQNIADSKLENAEVRKGIIEELPVDSESVDWVISNCVINLSPEKPKVFSEIARVLKPGGWMAVSDIVVQEMPDVVRNDQALYNSCVAGAISEEDYIQGLRDAGLIDVEVRERIVYDESQLRAFIEDEIPASGDSSCCSGPTTVALDTPDASCATPESGDAKTCGSGNQPADLVEFMTGKVWSAKFFARKPE